MSLLGNVHPSQTGQHLLKASNDSAEYLAQNFGTGGKEDQDCDYLLGVRKGGKMKLHPVGHLFGLQRFKEGLASDANMDTQLTNLQRKQNLVEEFGTKKSKKKLAQMLNNVVEENNISSSVQMKEFFQQKADTLREAPDMPDYTSQEQQMKDKQTFLPPFDLAATEPKGIYDLSAILSSEVLAAIDPEPTLECIRSPDTLAQNKKYFTAYTISMLSQDATLLKEKNSDTLRLKAKWIHGLDILLRFFRMRTV